MYTYTAGATGLDAVHAAVGAGGRVGSLAQTPAGPRDPQAGEARKCARRATGGTTCFWPPVRPDKVLLIGFKNDKLKPLTGKTLGEVARLRHTSPEDAAMDLVVEDDSRVGTVYFLMSEDNVRKQIVLPWVSFASDEDSLGNRRSLSEIERASAGFRQLCARVCALCAR